MNNEQFIWNYLKDKGLTDAGAAGLMGNLYAESGLNPINLQNTFEKTLGYTDDSYTKAVDSGKYKNFVKDKAGYGLCQWTYWSRKEKLLNFAKEKNKSIGDLQTQLDFLFVELNAGYGSLLKMLKTTEVVKEASNGVLLQFDRPADQSVAVQEKRASCGAGFYFKYAGKKGEQEVSINITKQTSNHNTSAKSNRKIEYIADFRYIQDDKVIVGIGLYIERKGIVDFVKLAKHFPEYKFVWFGYTNLNTVPLKIREAVETKLENLYFPDMDPYYQEDFEELA